MEPISQLLIGIMSLLKPSQDVGYCESRSLNTSELLNFFAKPDMCLKDEPPSWKYMYKLMDHYQMLLQTIIFYISLVSEQILHAKHTLAGWREQFHTQLEFCSNILMNDQLFVFVLKFSTLLLFLFVMHWLKTSRTSTKNISEPLLLPHKESTGCILPNNVVAEVLTPQAIICEFEFKTPTELRAETELLKSAMLDMEENKRRKRISKKRKCVSAGPILIHIRKPKKHRNHIDQPLIVPMLPPEEARDHYLPMRNKPLIVSTNKPEIKEAKTNNGPVEHHKEREFVYMCVYKFYFLTFN